LSGEQGSSSYELDLPNAGTTVVMGNLIEQGPNSENASMLTYGLEGLLPSNPGHDLHVVNNTFVNDRPNGGTFVNIGAAVDSPAQLQNNIFAGPGTLTNQASARHLSNFSPGDPLFVARAAYDYELEAGSPCIDQGSDAGKVGTLSLAPTWQYQHPSNVRMRVGVGAIDIGAYEFGAGNEAGAGGTSGVAGAAGALGNAGGAAEPPSASKSDTGCSCRAARSSSESRVPFVLLAPLLALFRRRIRARRSGD
jgi:hypothetical protein